MLFFSTSKSKRRLSKSFWICCFGKSRLKKEQSRGVQSRLIRANDLSQQELATKKIESLRLLEKPKFSVEINDTKSFFVKLSHYETVWSRAG